MRKRRSHKHKLCRPTAGATHVERLSVNGKWVPDDGEPGLAFSGKDAHGFPIAWYVDCRICEERSPFDRDNPENRAMERTFERFHGANGRNVPAVRKRK